MKQPRINRRQFFKLSAFGAGTVAASSLVSVVGSPPRHAVAEAEQPHKLAIPQPTFNPIASTLPSGGPPTDISAGWDGTLWAIDASGAPHFYDPTQDAWNAHGYNLSAAAWVGTTFYWFLVTQYTDSNGFPFNGVQVATAPFGGSVSAPQPIKALFPNVPDSFTFSLSGAANVASSLYLFNGGRYVPADGSASAIALNTLANWPTAAGWADGIIDAVHSDGTASVMLFNGPEFVIANLQTKTVTSGPTALSSYAPWQNRLPAGWATTGIDAAFTQGGNVTVYKGTQLAEFSQAGTGVATAQYISTINATSWPVTWHPILNHAPSGRMGNLWAATKVGGAVQHDGEAWNVRDNAGDGATNVEVGQDGSTWLCGNTSQTLWQWNGTGWSNVATSSVGIAQVTAGNAGNVFVRGTDNSVQRLGTGNAFAAVSLGTGVPLPTHMTANADGTLWHVNSSNPNAFRLISEATAPSAQIPVKGGGIVTGVSKVASTGYGAAHCLTTQSDGSTVVHRYDSPYVFKTAQSYNVSNAVASVKSGLGNLYMAIEVSSTSSANPEAFYIIALDAHTGVEVARSAAAAGTLRYTNPVFDPINELVYVGTADVSSPYDQTMPGQLITLDARTLQVKWSFQTTTGIDAAPTLSGTQLCFGDRLANLYMFDTRATLAAVASGQASTPSWKVATGFSGGQTERVATPVITNGMVYAVVWDVVASYQGQVTNVVGLFRCDADSGGNSSIQVLGVDPDILPQLITVSPTLGTVKAIPFANPDTPVQVPALWINTYHTIWAVPLDKRTDLDYPYSTFTLPGGGTAITGLAWDDGTRLGAGLPGPGQATSTRGVWFGDSSGNLWGLGDGPLAPIGGTPHNIPNGTSTTTEIATTPVLYKDPQGGLTVLFGVQDPRALLVPSLYGYDPDNQNEASIPTGVTEILVLSEGTTNGVVYAAGVREGATSQVPQVFSIRVDELPQALRDFVIESQMMQDPDQNAAGGDPSNNVPPSVARYQTHLTVVDDLKSPLPHESVKIWCDTPNTTITVDGVPFTVGPDDGSYAAVKTGTDGSIVITMDATDYFAPTLRVWASFMDPYERIVVNPDTEFHQRVMTAHTNASDDDPDKVNLQTATNYNGKSLFTDDEKNADPPTPQNVANSIQTANKGLGLSNTSTKVLYRKMMRAMGVKHKNQRVRVTILQEEAAAATPDKYMAYADLPGATSFPTNTPASRLATIAQPIGFSFSRPGGDVTQLPVFTALSHTDARAQIDALQGEPWKPTDPTGNGAPDFRPLRTLNIFQDFWNWLKKAFAEIAQCILSIAEDIMAGINYFIQGVLKVFKAIIKVLEDVFPFLGSFFKMLEKLIDDVVAALSVLLHFGEIMWTHRWLAGQFQSRVNDMTAAISTTITQNIDSFFEKGESAVKALFDKLRADVNSGTGINNLKGAGATPHTMFTVGPRGGTATSHSVQCTYGSNKLKQGAPSATEGSSLVKGNRPAAGAGDPVSDFFNAFVARLSNDPNLSAAFNQLKTDGSNLLSPSSAKQFFTSLIDTLLDILEALIVGALAVANALIDGLLAVINDVINAVMSILTAEIEIPFITWLYNELFGEPLTFLNLATLVVAIPVTIICRVVEGQYPSQIFPPVSAMQANRATAAPDIVIRYLGVFNGILAFVYGLVNAIGDAEGDDAPAVVSKISLGVGLMMEAFSFPLIANDASDVTPDDWTVYGIGMAAALLGIGGVSYTGSDGQPTTPMDGTVQSVLTSILNVTLLTATIVAFVEDGKTDAVTDVGFAGGLTTTLPGMINPLKLAGEEAALVVGAVDFVAGCIVGALAIYVAVASTASDPRSRRLFLPFVLAGGGGMQTIPAHP